MKVSQEYLTGKRRKILEATKELIIERGFKDISVRNIKEKAEISQGTIYVYFKNKEEIFVSLVDDFFSEAEKLIRQATEAEGDSINKLKTFVKADLKFYEKNLKLFKMLGKEMESIRNMCDIEYHQEIYKKYIQLVDSIAGIIKQGIKEKRIINVTPREGSLVLVSIIHAYAGQKAHGFSGKLLTEQTEKVLNIFLKGVGR